MDIKIYAKIFVDNCNPLIVPIESLQGILETEIADGDFLENVDRYSITFCAITEAAYEALDEWEGW
jgi:hypothetical protein